MTESVSSTSYSSYFSSSSTGSSDELGKDQFLELLTYQLKNQNPLDPYDNQEFSSQLAQFSQLEYLADIRTLIEDQVDTNLILTNTISNTALPGLLGKSAKALSDSMNLEEDGTAAIGYSLPYQAASGEILIKDSEGNVVRTMELDALDLVNGDHKLTWDGCDDDGTHVDAGDYTFEVNAYDSDGSDIRTDTYTYGEITAVRFTSDGTKLVMNGMEIALEDVMDITTST